MMYRTSGTRMNSVPRKVPADFAGSSLQDSGGAHSIRDEFGDSVVDLPACTLEVLLRRFGYLARIVRRCSLRRPRFWRRLVGRRSDRKAEDPNQTNGYCPPKSGVAVHLPL